MACKEYTLTATLYSVMKHELNKNNYQENESFGMVCLEEKTEFSESKYGTRNLSPCPKK